MRDVGIIRAGAVHHQVCATVAVSRPPASGSGRVEAMEHSPTIQGEPDPPWLRQAWDTAAHEWVEYTRASVAMTLRPRQFMQEWAAGRSKALNPLACILNAAAVLTAFGALLRLRGRGDQVPDWYDLLVPALLLFNAAVSASMFHFPLKLFGARGRWRTSFAATLFVASGPGLLLSLAREVALPLDSTRLLHGERPGMAGMACLAVIGASSLGYLAVALAGAQRVRLWRVGTALLLSIGLLVGGSLLLKKFQVPVHVPYSGVAR